MVSAFVQQSPSTASDPRFWVGHRVFVTGATGLVGSWVVRELQALGADVVALVRDRVPQSHLWSSSDVDRLVCVHGALEDFDVLARAINEYEIETVLHLGAQTIVPTANRSPLSTFESNIRGTWHVLEACRSIPGIRAVVVASSDKAYGGHDRLPYDESTPLIGRHPYDVSKSCADLIAQAYHETYDLPVCITRCGNLYGPGDLNFNRLVPGTIRSVIEGRPLVIRSDGSFVRDYFYVRDAALAYLLLVERMHEGDLGGEAFNFSNEAQLSVLGLVEKICEVMGVEVEPVILDGGGGEIKEQYLSAAKAREVLGWRPAFTLDDGLAETVRWYSQLLAVEQSPKRSVTVTPSAGTAPA